MEARDLTLILLCNLLNKDGLVMGFLSMFWKIRLMEVFLFTNTIVNKAMDADFIFLQIQCLDKDGLSIRLHFTLGKDKLNNDICIYFLKVISL